MYQRPRGSNRTRYESDDLYGDQHQTEDDDAQPDPQSSAYPTSTSAYQYPPQASSTADDTNYGEERYGEPSSRGFEYVGQESRGHRFEEVEEEDYYSSRSARQDRSSRRSTTSHAIRCTWPDCSRTFTIISERDRHYRTIHANNAERPFECEVSGCPASVTSWTTAAKLKQHNKQWHGPYHCREASCNRRRPNGFGSQEELDTHMNEAHYRVDRRFSISSIQQQAPAYSGISPPWDGGGQFSTVSSAGQPRGYTSTTYSLQPSAPGPNAGEIYSVQPSAPGSFAGGTYSNQPSAPGPMTMPQSNIQSGQAVSGASHHYALSLSGNFPILTERAYSSQPSAPASAPQYDMQSVYVVPEVFNAGNPSIPANASRMDFVTAGMSRSSINDNVISDNRVNSRGVDDRYKLQKPSFFKFGRVFKVSWSEPVGNDGTDISDDESSRRSERSRKYERSSGRSRHFTKARRFIVISPRNGHCLCLSVLTYSGRGVMKPGVHAEEHAPLYAEGGEPVLLEGEADRGLTREAIAVVPDSRSDALNPISRLNYAKVYTIEYNVKVCSVGQVSTRSEWDLTQAYNEVHPPLEMRGSHPPPPGSTFAFPLPPTSGSYSGNYPPVSTDPFASARDPTSYPTAIYQQRLASEGVPQYQSGSSPGVPSAPSVGHHLAPLSEDSNPSGPAYQSPQYGSGGFYNASLSSPAIPGPHGPTPPQQVSYQGPQYESNPSYDAPVVPIDEEYGRRRTFEDSYESGTGASYAAPTASQDPDYGRRSGREEPQLPQTSYQAPQYEASYAAPTASRDRNYSRGREEQEPPQTSYQAPQYESGLSYGPPEDSRAYSSNTTRGDERRRESIGRWEDDLPRDRERRRYDRDERERERRRR